MNNDEIIIINDKDHIIKIFNKIYNENINLFIENDNKNIKVLITIDSNLTADLKNYIIKKKVIEKAIIISSNINTKSLIYNSKIINSLLTEKLHQLGIFTNNKGYYYIKEAVLLVIQKRKNEGYNFTKELYVPIAEKFQTKPKTIESNIRNAIIKGVDKTSPEILEKYFGYSIDYNHVAPTNTTFILTIAEMIKLEID